MVLIKVKPKDKEKVFSILSRNGRFIGLSENRFSILENSEKTLQKIKEEGIEYELLE